MLNLKNGVRHLLVMLFSYSYFAYYLGDILELLRKIVT